MSMVPSFFDISYFIETAKSKNISRASEKLGITQPSLSVAIKRLEKSLGTTLFVRSRTGVHLTKSGKELLIAGSALLLNWEQLKSNINKREKEVIGQYVIGCHPSVALCTLPHFLPQLIQNYPELNIKLEHDLSRKITESVISFKIDFGVVVNPIRHPDLVIKKLCRDEVLFWVSENPSPTQVIGTDKSVLVCDLNLIQVQKLMRDLQKKKQGFKRVIQSSNLEVIASLTASGVGVGIIPQRIAEKLNGHKLNPMKGQMPSFKDEICLVYRQDYQKTKGGEIIINAIKKAIY